MRYSTFFAKPYALMASSAIRATCQRHQQHPHVRRPPLSSYMVYRGQPGQLQPLISGFNSLELMEQNTPPTRLFLMNVRQLLQTHFAFVSAFNGTFIFGIISFSLVASTQISSVQPVLRLRFYSVVERHLCITSIGSSLRLTAASPF